MNNDPVLPLSKYEEAKANFNQFLDPTLREDPAFRFGRYLAVFMRLFELYHRGPGPKKDPEREARAALTRPHSWYGTNISEVYLAKFMANNQYSYLRTFFQELESELHSLPARFTPHQRADARLAKTQQLRGLQYYSAKHPETPQADDSDSESPSESV